MLLFLARTVKKIIISFTRPNPIWKVGALVRIQFGRQGHLSESNLEGRDTCPNLIWKVGILVRIQFGRQGQVRPPECVALHPAQISQPLQMIPILVKGYTRISYAGILELCCLYFYFQICMLYNLLYLFLFSRMVKFVCGNCSQVFDQTKILCKFFKVKIYFSHQTFS